MTSAHPTAAARATLLQAMSEREWQAQVLAWARQGGWLVFHHHDGRSQEWYTHSGFPDLVLVHPRRKLRIFAELKTQRGKVTPRQQVWLDALSGMVWRPSDHNEVRALLLGVRETRVTLEEVEA